MRVLKYIDTTELDKLQAQKESLKQDIIKIEKLQEEKIKRKSFEYFGCLNGINGYSNLVNEEILYADDNICIYTKKGYGYMIYGELELEVGCLQVEMPFYHDEDKYISKITYNYSKRIVNDIPKKYKDHEKLLVQKMCKYKVYDPFKKYEVDVKYDIPKEWL